MKLFVADTRHGESCPSELFVRLEINNHFVRAYKMGGF
jgi:hypothetical protein